MNASFREIIPPGKMIGAGYVLAGGSSRRLGQDKAFLEVGGLTLVERAVRTLQALGLEVRVVCGSEGQAGLIKCPAILDRIPGRGPVMGICSALRHSDHRDNCFHSCDMPLVPSELLRKLWTLKSGFDVVVPTDLEDRIQPLCGIYSRKCLEVLEKTAQQGRLEHSRHLEIGAAEGEDGAGSRPECRLPYLLEHQ